MNDAEYSVERIEFDVDSAPLFFRRGLENRTGAPVLFLHGASASCDTFLEPKGRSIFDFLNKEYGLDVWLLDWRGSHWVTPAAPGACNEPADTVAKRDIPLALDYIREKREYEGYPGPVAIVAHCVGAACLAMAIGAQHVSAAKGLGPVVLSSVGLFYEVTWDGLSKLQDRLLDRLADQNAHVQFITPDQSVAQWPDAMEELYKMWPEVWGPPWKESKKNDFFHRLAFMYGQPFLVSNLHPRMTPAVIRTQFGAIPFKLYQHATQNALRGFAAPFGAEGKLDPNTTNEAIPDVLASEYLRLEAFRDLKITLITGADNPLWHRDSIDRMAEWVARRGQPATKHVLDGYGHQDLWWGKRSWEQVFPLILRAVVAAQPAEVLMLSDMTLSGVTRRTDADVESEH
jgi:pimeloyl-ACP methyl ester carboxylesterase